MTDKANTPKLNLTAKTGLMALALLQALMLAALYTGTPPHPPLEIAPFALGPFLSASIVLAIAAHQLAAERMAPGLAIAACLTALVSYGPHKYLDAAFPQIWPAVILAQVAIITVVVDLGRQLRTAKA